MKVLCGIIREIVQLNWSIYVILSGILLKTFMQYNKGVMRK